MDYKINRPNLYLRNGPGIIFAIIFVTRFHIYTESFIPKYFMLDDLLGKNHFHRLQPLQMTAIMNMSKNT